MKKWHLRNRASRQQHGKACIADTWLGKASPGGNRVRWFPTTATVAVILALTLAFWHTYGVAGARSGAPEASSSTSDGDYKLGILDKVRVKVIEWRASRDEVFEWEALNAEYTIGPSGKLSMPLVGELRAAGLSTSDLARIIGDRLRERMGLVASPDTSVEVVLFRPFYITGQVDKPGEYPYRPGLTVLQAVTISGGLRRGDVTTTRLERDVITSKGELDMLALELNVLLARSARLESEMKRADQIIFPNEFLRRRAEPAIAMLIEQEEMVFQARRSGFETQVETLKHLKGYLEREVQSLTGQLGVHGTQLNLVKQELSAVSTLADKGLATAPRRLALERTVAQLEGDHMRLETALLKVQQDISRTEISIIELHNKRTNEASTELQLTQNKIEQIKQRTETSEKLLYEAEVIAPRGLTDRGRMRKLQPVYRIQRMKDGLVVEMSASEVTPIEPGDSIKVDIPLSDELSSSPVSPSEASPRGGPGLQRFSLDALGRVQN